MSGRLKKFFTLDFFFRHVLVWLAVVGLLIFTNLFATAKYQGAVFMLSVMALVFCWLAYSRLMRSIAFWAVFAVCYLAAFFVVRLIWK